MSLPVSAQASISCGRIEGGEVKVLVERGHVPCREARKVMAAFLSGQGTEHGGPDSPSYRKSWSLHGGWRCGHAAGGGGCTRGGMTFRDSRDWITAFYSA
jgi:hypothetical protein